MKIIWLRTEATGVVVGEEVTTIALAGQILRLKFVKMRPYPELSPHIRTPEESEVVAELALDITPSSSAHDC
jgi:hypothetical protein